ncbi:hypothetical protein [Halorussus lipolyticus]|nr:hypothetical protein [Halorussus sp. DT80]
MAPEVSGTEAGASHIDSDDRAVPDSTGSRSLSAQRGNYTMQEFTT